MTGLDADSAAEMAEAAAALPAIQWPVDPHEGMQRGIHGY